MKQLIRNGWLVVILCAGLLVVGCAGKYYKVTDPQSGNTFYTESIEGLSGGAVKLKDARSNSTVTLQNSQVKEITENEYKAGLAAPVAPVSKPTPTAAATPMTAPTPTAAAAPTAAPAPAPAAAPSAAPAPAPATAPAPAPGEAPK